ncbi:uncharacterized protein [Onthophagus taurus]|uniref:uncharacterized protein n=1 Tax=Onthophagus taurus TaxID=166361 RepID=UPI000C204CFE|nr:probable 4-coumarate--CoA ligase 3 [Onthophagus taurus]
MSIVCRVLVNNAKCRTIATFPGRRSQSTKLKPQLATTNGFLKSSFLDVPIPETNLAEYAMEFYGDYADRIALECGITGRNYTFDEVRVKSRNLNKTLRKKLKLQRGDVVALFLPNIPEFPICVFGSILAGLKVTTLNPAYTPDEIHRQLVDSGAKIIITINPLYQNCNKAIDKLDKKIPISIIKEKQDELLPQGTINFKELIDEKLDLPDITNLSPDDTAFLPYSSGTTGLPKGVMLSNRNLVGNIQQIGSDETKFAKLPDGSHQDCYPSILPLFHIYGFTSSVSLLRTGCKTVTLSKFTPELYIQTIIKHKPNILMLVPPIVLFLSAHPAVKTEYFANLETTMCGAAPLGPLDEQKFREKVAKPCTILQGYGLTEASPVVTQMPTALQGKYVGSMGHPVSLTEVKVVDINDPELKHLGPNQTGELLVKGPQVMQGYHNKPKETEETFIDGWLRTGDMVYYNEDLLFFIADRIKELIKVKGFQVPPAELEQLIRDFPGIQDAAVIGVPHPINGEAPRAYIVPKQGQKVDVNKLKEFVESKVAKHKKLSGGISIVDSIPKNASGKTLRKELKNKFEKEGI